MLFGEHSATEKEVKIMGLSHCLIKGHFHSLYNDVRKHPKHLLASALCLHKLWQDAAPWTYIPKLIMGLYISAKEQLIVAMRYKAIEMCFVTSLL